MLDQKVTELGGSFRYSSEAVNIVSFGDKILQAEKLRLWLRANNYVSSPTIDDPDAGYLVLFRAKKG